MTDTKQDVRQQFEKEAAILGLSLERWPTGQSFRDGSAKDYYEPTETAWRCYQAALQSPAVRELVEALRAYFGPMDDPRVGWCGHSPSHRDLFQCESCGQEHLDSSLIQHKPDCSAISLRAALRTLGAGHVE